VCNNYAAGTNALLSRFNKNTVGTKRKEDNLLYYNCGNYSRMRDMIII